MSAFHSSAREHPTGPPSRGEESDWTLRQLMLDLHDGPVQYICAALMQLEVLNRTLEREEASEQARATTTRIGQFLECAASELRGFLGDVSPLNMDGFDLPTLLRGLVYRHRMLTGTEVRFEAAEHVPEPPLAVRLTLYRVLQEALSNAYRHSGAKQVSVQLGSVGVPGRQELWMVVEDDGRGFAPGRIRRDGHFGLTGMRERLQAVGGMLTIRSESGAGTTVRASVEVM
jgi:signal transduction histidine kinase